MDPQPRNDADSGEEPPTSAGIELGQTLKRWREESNRSQNVVAKKLGTKQPTVSRWESGATLPAVEAIQALWRIRTQATETPSSDTELDRALELHQRAEMERGRGPKLSSTPAPQTTTASASSPVPAETGRKRTVLTILAASGAVVLVVAFLAWHFAGSTQTGGADRPSASAASARPAPPATCSGASCTSVEPTTTVCAQDAVTAYSGRSYGVLVELRYSPRCHAAWAKMSGTSQGDRITLAIGHDDENSQEYRQQTGHDAHTRMIHVDDLSGVRACAIVEGRGTVCATKAASGTTRP
ncbi:hypothetical protein GCM10020367_70630 [Streptomyces sannanensis]|uniref:HTH cro/C1-type domain-containing protein n=1 Tax=Streptomyces sannanensis TaxID=285536 RepID=A0ABP6SPI1_9ACTN